MLSKMFAHTSLLQKGLDASWQRNEVISHNLANVDTPNFKAQRVEFEGEFRRALEGNAFQAAKTHPGHIDFGTADPLAVSPKIVTDTATSMRMDGNNVDPDAEMVELAKNTIQYNMLVTKISKELARLKYAVREGR